LIRRIITKNALESTYSGRSFFPLCQKSRERWLNRSAFEEATDYSRLNVGLSTIGLEKMTFSSNVELEDRKQPDGLERTRELIT